MFLWGSKVVNPKKRGLSEVISTLILLVVTRARALEDYDVS
jgi:flagellin-like protein